MTEDKTPKGPSGYRYWKAHDAGGALGGIAEFTLYSDAHVTAEIRDGFGPYEILNTVAIARAQRNGEPLPAMVLRCRLHATGEEQSPDFEKGDDATWHAGGIDDELAALLSLALGIRVRSGGLTREFDNKDPLGSPREFSHKPPYLPPPSQRLLLPAATGTHRLDGASDLLASYPNLDTEAAVTLVRAARAYQEGIWVVEEDPEYTWLKLVSAVEAAAGFWWKDDADAIELLKDWSPDFADEIEAAGGIALLSSTASALLDLTRSTKKFISFLEHYLPSPPEHRPTHNQLDWSSLTKELRQVYTYRSKVLHGGKPFPGPMLSGPLHPTEPEERPFADTAVGESVWRAKDMPMHIHIFEHIARGALHNWWKDIGSS